MSVYKYLFSCLALWVGDILVAQDVAMEEWHYIQIDSTKQMWGKWDAPDWLRYFGLDAADVNGDGNLDIVSGRYVYHNPGGAMEGHWRRTVLDDNVDAIFSMDVDGDPYADIIAMALPKLYWYEALNAEGTKYTRKIIGKVPATSHVNSQGFEKAQLIPGGKSEFVIAGNGDIYAVSIPENDPTAELWEVTLICKNTSDEGIGIGDIDGDGDLDIAAGRRPDSEDEPKILLWFKNPGHLKGPWKEITIGKSEHPIDRVEIADINGDKKADIVITEERYPGLEPDANFWWFSQETGNSWQRHKIVTQYSINNLDVADLDADGDIDLLTAEHKGPNLELQLWKNDGKGNFEKTIIDNGKENHLGTQLIDLDNDGDLDIIGAGWDQHQYMHVWRNESVCSLKSGILFREYPWIPNRVGDKGKFLRVGGKLDYSINTDYFHSDGHKDGFIPLGRDLDLKNAIAAEVIVERVQSHEDTKNLCIQFNKGKPIHLPEPVTIPFPATDFMFHTNVHVSVPLGDLKPGSSNSFKLTVAKEQSWDWPQNLIYGIVVRVYYGPTESKNPEVTISGVPYGDALGKEVELSLTGPTLRDIVSVDYMGLYKDVNIQGDGVYRQWQYGYHRGKREHHIGTATEAPFKVSWNTNWIPDQQDPISLMALAQDKNGMIHILPTIDSLILERNHSVYLGKPYGQPPFWTTRNGEHTEYLDIPFEVSERDSVRMYWNSWSPCYSKGIQINGTVRAPDENMPCYDAHWHSEELSTINALKKDSNRITTLKTPLHDGKMVHGMEVQWPGIMLKIRREAPMKNPIFITKAIYENRQHYTITTKTATYYFDTAGGGFSRIIDNLGNDWIGFKMEPWDQYPVSAASSFRGLPNLVFSSETDKGAGHPGHDKCVSRVIAPNKIRTKTKSGLWEWEWTFYPDRAQIEILKTDGNTPYWFLYEGTPGGTYAPEKSVYGTDLSGPYGDVPDFYAGEIDFRHFKWAYFGRKEIPVSLFIAQLKEDKHLDMMSYLGNTGNGASSEDGMTVFGFGRGPNTTPLLTGKHKFIL
ncbi:MAG: VCBS repeat-containing protein [Bacteroidota bacterium]